MGQVLLKTLKGNLVSIEPGYLRTKDSRNAELSDLSQSYIGEIEIGRKFPSAQKLQKITDGLGMKPYQLFLDSVDQKEFNRYEVISKLYTEIKGRIDKDLEEIIKKYMS